MMKELTICPSTLKKGFDSYSPVAIKRLFGGEKVSHVLDFGIDQFRSQDIVTHAMKKISVSGVQEKFPAIVKNGKIRLSSQDERSRYILKPAPWDETIPTRKQIPANEHLTMQIASQVYGIKTAENGLCFTNDGQMVYITRRFDINDDDSKMQMEDFASLSGKSEQTGGAFFKYDGCYEEIAMALKRHVAAWVIDMERLFELILFNYIYGNGDDHAKNFSLIRIGNDYRLAPAYDLLNTCIHLDGDDFGLSGGLSPNIEKSDVYDHTGHPCRLDFERFAMLIGLPESRTIRVLDKYIEIPAGTIELINNSFLNDKMKRKYLRIVDERTKRFIRKSE